MDSKLDLSERLLQEGHAFTWENFCYESKDHPGRYAGADQPGWIAWKTRTFNTINHIVAEGSPALRLAEVGARIPTSRVRPRTVRPRQGDISQGNRNGHCRGPRRRIRRAEGSGEYECLTGFVEQSICRAWARLCAEDRS